MGDLYKQFRGAIARQAVAVGPLAQKWIYYDSGPKEMVPMICVHGTSGSADVFYHQISSLTVKGYRVISAQYPAYFTASDWVRGFDRFLDAMSLPKVHLLGTSLGGYLVLHYLKTYPLRVASIVLCNGFCDTTIFAENAPCVNMFRYLPEFYLKKYILDNFPQDELEHRIATAVDFVVGQLESLDRDSIAARLTLNCTQGTISEISEFDQTKVTVLDTFDAVSLPESMRDQLYNLLPHARYAHLKTGGDFPYLSRSDEFSMLLQVHLRGVGCHPNISGKDKHISGLSDEESKLVDEGELRAQEEVTQRALQMKYEEQERKRRANLRDKLERERLAEERLLQLEEEKIRNDEKAKYEEERQRRVEQYNKQKEERLKTEAEEERQQQREESARREKANRENEIFQNLIPDDKRPKDDIFS